MFIPWPSVNHYHRCRLHYSLMILGASHITANLFSRHYRIRTREIPGFPSNVGTRIVVYGMNSFSPNMGDDFAQSDALPLLRQHHYSDDANPDATAPLGLSCIASRICTQGALELSSSSLRGVARGAALCTCQTQRLPALVLRWGIPARIGSSTRANMDIFVRDAGVSARPHDESRRYSSAAPKSRRWWGPKSKAALQHFPRFLGCSIHDCAG
jgi:hypothetical protein